MYLGNQPALSYTSFAKQDFTTSATTSYTLDNPVANANELALFINFVRQEPTTAYSASGTSLTLTSATSATDDMYCVYLGKAVQTVNPPNGSVGASQLVDSSIALGKLTATGTKDATTFLRGDNTFASAGGANTPYFEAYRSTGQAISNGSYVTCIFDTEVYDADGIYNNTNGRLTPTTAGKYFVSTTVIGGNDGSSSLNYVLAKFYKNGSVYQTSTDFKQDSRGYPGSNYSVSMNSIVDFNGSTDYFEVKINMDTTVGTPDLVVASNFLAYKIIE